MRLLDGLKSQSDIDFDSIIIFISRLAFGLGLVLTTRDLDWPLEIRRYELVKSNHTQELSKRQQGRTHKSRNSTNIARIEELFGYS
jgi:hypothetical protein